MDPSDVQASFKLAYSVASPRYRTAIREAYMEWAETPTSAGSSNLGDAVGCACRTGGVYAGALLIGAAVETTTETLIAEAEANLGRPLTEYERKAVELGVASAEAGQSLDDPASTWWYYVQNYSPPGLAVKLGTEAYRRTQNTLQSAADTVNDAAAEAAAAAEAQRQAALAELEAWKQEWLRRARKVATGAAIGVAAVLGVIALTAVAVSKSAKRA